MSGRVGHSGPKPITARPSKKLTPLSLGQEQIVRRSYSDHATPSLYNESVTLHRNGLLDKGLLEYSFMEIIRRHEAWRTTYGWIGEEPFQCILPPPSDVQIATADLRDVPAAQQNGEVLRLANEDARRPFDLGSGPLVRAFLVTLDERQHKLFFTMHQSVVDGVSVYRILPWELTALYDALSAHQGSPLSDLTLQFGDFAYWEREWSREQSVMDQLGYWRAQLPTHVSPLSLPQGRPQQSRNSFNGSMFAFSLSIALCTALRAVSEAEGVSLFTVLLAGFSLLLGNYSGQDDLVVGTISSSGRKRPEVQGLLGYFLNPLALRIKLSSGATVRALLRHAQEVICAALTNDDVPIEHVTKEVCPAVAPLGDSLLRMVITLAPPLQQFRAEWSQTPMDVDAGWARWDLYLEMSEGSSGMVCRVQYKTDVFPLEAIERFARDYTVTLQTLVNRPDEKLSRLLAN